MIWTARILLFSPFFRAGLDLAERQEITGALGLLLAIASGVMSVASIEIIAKHYRAKEPTP